MHSRILKAIASAGILVLALTGCVDIKNTVNIKNDGTATVEYQLLIQNSYLESMGMTPDQYLENMAEENPNSNTTFEPIKTDTGTGGKTTTEVIWEGDKTNFGTKAIADKAESDSVPTLVKREGDNIKVGFPFANEDEAGGEEEMGSAEDLGIDSFDLSVTFPGEVKEASHGGKIEGNKVTWNLDNISDSVKSKEMITAVGSSGEGSGNGLIIFIIMGLMILTGGGLFAWKILKKRKEDKDSDDYIDGLEKQHATAITELKRQATDEKKQGMEENSRYTDISSQNTHRAVPAPLTLPRMLPPIASLNRQASADTPTKDVRTPISKLPPLPPLPPRPSRP